MRPKSIPDKHHAFVLRLAGEGRTSREISAELAAIGVTASHACVARLLRGMRAERAEISKAVLRSELSSTLTVDVRRLETLVKKTLRRLRGVGGNDAAYCKLCEQARKLIEAKLKHSGADEPDPENEVRRPMIFIPAEVEPE